MFLAYNRGSDELRAILDEEVDVAKAIRSFAEAAGMANRLFSVDF